MFQQSIQHVHCMETYNGNTNPSERHDDRTHSCKWPVGHKCVDTQHACDTIIAFVLLTTILPSPHKSNLCEQGRRTISACGPVPGCVPSRQSQPTCSLPSPHAVQEQNQTETCNIMFSNKQAAPCHNSNELWPNAKLTRVGLGSCAIGRSQNGKCLIWIRWN